MISTQNKTSTEDPPSISDGNTPNKIMSTTPSPPPNTETEATPTDIFAHEDRDTDPGHFPTFHSTLPPAKA